MKGEEGWIDEEREGRMGRGMEGRRKDKAQGNEICIK